LLTLRKLSRSRISPMIQIQSSQNFVCPFCGRCPYFVTTAITPTRLNHQQVVPHR
jgi:hypothetical protein